MIPSDRTLPYILFLFLLSGLLSASASRSESRYSLAASRLAFGGGALLSTVMLAFRLITRRSGVISDFSEGILLSIVLLGAIWVVLEWRFRSLLDPAFFASLGLILGVAGLGRSLPGTAVPRSGPGFGSHTFFMFAALAAFSLSFIFSVLFLIQDFLLKRKRFGHVLLRLPPLELTGRLNFSFLTLGTASWFAGVASGVVFLFASPFSAAFFFQPMSLLSFLLLGIYGLILMLRVGPVDRHRASAWASVLAYSMLLAVFLIPHPLGLLALR